ncbi:hypothetical protein CNMCM8980_007103 [Aspergillus fumigatiaffinis]|uniref:Btz domain-containing protein n=1 Tax=Aspergillus fumigatiaffinis TaxID=340414 RepID=A0A8H4H867_9EURO|nr:hypothetical protein CNMCM6805_006999 [Aspergillus fumigatiaffinis]KAF4247594.1 hypothetical protein CNMCM8980_007103 [Aspergillus fumigatiaffinis]
MASRRRNIGASRRRRRRDEEGEDEGSLEGELEDDSLSEGSVISHPGDDEDDADGEGSDESDGEASSSPHLDRTNGPQVNGLVPEINQRSGRRHSSSPGKRHTATAVSDTEAMMNGLTLSDQTNEVAEIHFDDMKGEPGSLTGRTPSAPPTEAKRGTFAERKRREHERYAKERDENPAFVPTRGRFFLHDKRSTESGPNGHRPFNKSKSRPYGLIVDGNVGRHSKPDASEGQWTHDLHEMVAGDEPVNKPSAVPGSMSNFAPKPVPTAPRSTPPNRSFSSTTLIGNVPVVVFLQGMARPIPFPAVPKKQHTRLPQHRPPLRRDKPVRISFPGQSPRYIFPSTERSFIFIPRALRPNQQGYRGRGRGGFYGGRRPSIYAGSVYTPSVTASRRSSMGKSASHDGYPSPAASVLSRHTVVTTENGKPIVRLPPPSRPLGGVPPAVAAAGPGAVVTASLPQPMPQPQPQQPSYRESRPAPIPMHQPRPQKAVSVADIETPASFSFNAPQPQQEQPFQHQVPVPINGPGYGTDAQSAHAAGTPSSHIPERAIHAQPFQPYGFQQAQPFYPTAYPPGTVYYPVSGTEFPPYNAAGMPGASLVPYPPAGQQAPYVVPGAHASSAEQPSQPGTVAHEAGGTVYFYDATQMWPNASYATPSAPGSGGVIGMGGMMTPPGTTFYYPQPQGGVYYAPQ